jgi:hypothetical protein
VTPAVRGLALAVVAALAGCFDWDRLETPRDDDLPIALTDGGNAKDGPIADLSMVVPGVDMANRCVLPKPTSGLFMVTPGGPMTIQEAVNQAIGVGAGSMVFIAEGNYPETLDISGPIQVYGSFTSDFTCRDLNSHTTVITGAQDDIPTVTFGKGAALDGLQIFGVGKSTPVAVMANPGAVSIGHSILRSQIDLTSEVTVARGLVVSGVKGLTIDGCDIESGLTNHLGDFSASTAVYLCSSTATINASAIGANQNASIGSTGLLIDQTCGGLNGNDIFLQDSLIYAHSTGFALGLHSTATVGMTNIHLAGSALTGASTSKPYAIYTDGSQPQNLFLSEATVSASGSMAATAIHMETGAVMIQTTDSIISGGFALVDADGMPMLNGTGHNLYYATMTDNSDGGMGQPVLLLANGVPYDLAWVITKDPAAAYGNPLFQPDGYHLMIGSPAIDKGMPPCAVAIDIDGEMRPKGTKCDIGADEF